MVKSAVLQPESRGISGGQLRAGKSRAILKNNMRINRHRGRKSHEIGK